MKRRSGIGNRPIALARAMGLLSLLVVALAIAASGCNDSNNVLTPPGSGGGGGGGGTNLVVSNSTPADGDGTITVTGTLTIDANGSGFDELSLSEPGHDVFITWDTNTHAVNFVQHGWSSGIAQCDDAGANPCDANVINLDFTGKTITFTNLVLPEDPLSTGSMCALNGPAIWL